MLELKELLEIRDAYGEVYHTVILDQEFIFRPIGREEYKQLIVMDMSLGELQEAACFQAVVYPTDYNFSEGPAGIAEVIYDGILEASGLHVGQASELSEGYRAEMMEFDYQIDCLIHEAFPEFTLEEIMNWPVRKTMFYWSRAEWILVNLKGINLDYLTLEESQAQKGNVPQESRPPQPVVQQQERIVSTPVQNDADPQMDSEASVLAMLAATGNKVVDPHSTSIKGAPELNWFQYMDDLIGDEDDL